MGNLEKKVIVFIVEGASDKAALGTIIQEYFSSEKLEFVVIGGDITTDFSVSVENIVSKLNNLVQQTMEKYGYDPDDIIEIIHLADTDGAFVNSTFVKENKLATEILYFEDRMETDNVKSTISRNDRKKAALEKLFLTGHICDSLKAGGIKYRIYYNSCNLEHVLYGELKSYTDAEKIELADEFAEKYEDDINGFINFITNPEFAVLDSFKKTWMYIEKDNNSLKRHTNLGLIFRTK